MFIYIYMYVHICKSSTHVKSALGPWRRSLSWGRPPSGGGGRASGPLFQYRHISIFIIYPSIYLSIYPSIHIYMYLYMCLYIHIYIHIYLG